MLQLPSSGAKTPVCHCSDVIMGAIAFQIHSITIVSSTVYSDADQIKHQSSEPLAFVRGIHRWPVNSPHKWPVTQKMFPFDDVIIVKLYESLLHNNSNYAPRLLLTRLYPAYIYGVRCVNVRSKWTTSHGILFHVDIVVKIMIYYFSRNWNHSYRPTSNETMNRKLYTEKDSGWWITTSVLVICRVNCVLNTTVL